MISSAAPAAATSIVHDPRAADPIVHADKTDIDVLANAVALKRRATRHGGQLHRAAPQENVVILDSDRPIGCEAVLKASTYSAASDGSAEALLGWMETKIDKLCAERDRLKAKAPRERRGLGGRFW